MRFVGFADLVSASTLVIADADAGAWSSGSLDARLVTRALGQRLLHATDPAIRPITEAAFAAPLARLALAVDSAVRVTFTVRSHDDVGNAVAPAPVVEWLSSMPDVVTSLWQPRPTQARPLSRREALKAALWHDPDRAVALLPDSARRAALERRREEAFGAVLSEGHPLLATLPIGPMFEPILIEETGGGEKVHLCDRDRPHGELPVQRLRRRGLAPEATLPDTRESPMRARRVSSSMRLSPRRFARPKASGHAVHATLSRIMRLGLDGANRALALELRGSSLARVAALQVRASVRAVLEWSLADESWDFAVAEQAVGEPGGWAEVILERVESRVRLRGRVDRVDVRHSSGAVRIIDYKRTESSARDFTASFGETRFQLPIYGRAAENALGAPAREGLYLPTQRLRPESQPAIPEREWELAHERTLGVARFEAWVLDLLGTIRRGRVEVRPFAPSSCTYCDLSGVCRKPRFVASASVDIEAPPDPAPPRGDA